MLPNVHVPVGFTWLICAAKNVTIALSELPPPYASGPAVHTKYKDTASIALFCGMQTSK